MRGSASKLFVTFRVVEQKILKISDTSFFSDQIIIEL